MTFRPAIDIQDCDTGDGGFSIRDLYSCFGLCVKVIWMAYIDLHLTLRLAIDIQASTIQVSGVSRPGDRYVEVIGGRGHIPWYDLISLNPIIFTWKNHLSSSFVSHCLDINSSFASKFVFDFKINIFINGLVNLLNPIFFSRINNLCSYYGYTSVLLITLCRRFTCR